MEWFAEDSKEQARKVDFGSNNGEDKPRGWNFIVHSMIYLFFYSACISLPAVAQFFNAVFNI